MEGYRVIIYINYLNRFSKLFFVVKMPNFKAVSIGCIDMQLDCFKLVGSWVLHVAV